MRRPPVGLSVGYIRLVVVFGVSFATVGEEFDQRHPATGAGTIDRTLGHVVHGQHVVAVGLLAGDAVA